MVSRQRSDSLTFEIYCSITAALLSHAPPPLSQSPRQRRNPMLLGSASTGRGVKQLGRGASQVSPHPENKTPRLLCSQPFITQPQEEEERERGPGLQIIPEKGLKRCPFLSLLLNQPPTFFIRLWEFSQQLSLSLFLAEDKQRNSRTSVCLYSR